MNILMLLTPKKNVAFLTNEMTLEQALHAFRINRFSSVPLIDRKGYYVGTITEGDILRYLETNSYENSLTAPLSKITRNRDNAAVNINEEITQLLRISLHQNFIPILDDRGYFIGIVTRKDVLQYFFDKMNVGESIDTKRNPVLQALYSRRSIRKFSNEKIDENIINEILESGLISPTAANRKPTHMMFVDDQEKISKLSTVHIRGGQFVNAPYLLLVLNDDEVELNPYTANSNASALTMSLLLAIDSYDKLGGYWIAARHLDNNRAICDALDIPPSITLYAIIAFGIKDEFKPENEPDNNGRIHKNNW